MNIRRVKIAAAIFVLGFTLGASSISAQTETVTGCLDMNAGNLRLTDAHGTVWWVHRKVPSNVNLSSHVGQTVTVTGDQSGAKTQHRISVTSVTKVSDTCPK